MATIFLFRWASAPPAWFPSWVTPAMYTGQYDSPSKYTTCVSSQTTGGLTARKSGKVTSGFMKALFRAKMITNGCDVDGYGANVNVGIAEMTVNDTLEGSIVGLGQVACVAYNSVTGSFNASKSRAAFDVAKESTAPLFLSMWNFFCNDTAFFGAFSTFCQSTDTDILASNACLMADIAYYGIRDGIFKAPALASDVANLTATRMGTPGMQPTTYLGNFQIFPVSKGPSKNRASSTTGKSMDTDKFVNSFAFRTDKLDEAEEQLVPQISDKYIVGDVLINICKHIKESTNRPRPIRNILLRGEPGTGKTEMYVGIAAGCHLPLYTFAANAMTEPFDLFGQFVPVDEDGKRSGAKVPVGDILKNMPSATDISMDPVLSYQEITGLYKADATSMDCMSAAFQLAQRNLEKESNGQQKFKFVPGQLVYAMKNGGVWGFDEVTLPQNPGVVPALNPAMDGTQNITLPTGEIINRHPSCIFVGTTNIDLEGCRRLNQAWVDRCQLIIDVAEPNDAELIARVKAMTDYNDATDSSTVDLYKFVRAYHELKAITKKRRLEDGMIGPRHLADWVLSTLITKDPLTSAKMTIVSGATSDEKGMAELNEKLSDMF